MKKKTRKGPLPTVPSGGSGRESASAPGSAGGPAGLSGRWTVPGVCLFLAVITWTVFGQTLGHGFVNYDDNLYIADNPAVLGGLSLDGILWAFTHNVNANWTPLTVISHMLDCQFYGTDAGWHHRTSVLLHLASVIVLFLVLKEMTAALWRSAFVAAVFAVHPLHVESVAWIAERRDVLSGLFFMLTLGAYVRYVQKQSSAPAAPAPGPGLWTPDYALVLLFFALGLLSKPMVVTLPFVLLLLDYWPLNRFQQPGDRSVLWRLIVEKVPLLALAGAASAATLFAQQEIITPLPLPVRLGNALVSCAAYLKQMVYPVGLAVYYPHPGSGLAPGKIIAALVLLLAISVGAVAARRKRPWFLFGWLWYLGMLVPVIGLVQSGLRAQADRYTYLPQIGLYVLLTWAAAELGAGWRHRRLLLGGGAAAVLGALIFSAHTQAAYWRDSESLWTHTLACTSDNAVARNGLGNALLKNGSVDEAMVQYQRAMQVEPGYGEAPNNLGNVLLQEGRLDEAIACYQKALETDPNFAAAHNDLGVALLQKGSVDEAIVHCQKALQLKPGYVEAWNTLGNGRLQSGSVDEAIADYQRALELNPDFAEAHNSLGNALLQKGNVDAAILNCQKALQLKPGYVEAWNTLGNALLQKGRVDEAIADYQRALELNPDFAEAHNNLGNALLQKGRLDEALAHCQRALQIKPDYAGAHCNLGNALLQKGSVDAAVAHYQKALELKPAYLEVQNNLAWVLATAPQASLRDGPRAVALAESANQLAGGKNPTILHTLAAAYAEAGRFDDARQSARAALALAQAAGQSNLVALLDGELKLYTAGRPFHQAGP